VTGKGLLQPLAWRYKPVARLWPPLTKRRPWYGVVQPIPQLQAHSKVRAYNMPGDAFFSVSKPLDKSQCAQSHCNFSLNCCLLSLFHCSIGTHTPDPS